MLDQAERFPTAQKSGKEMRPNKAFCNHTLSFDHKFIEPACCDQNPYFTHCAKFKKAYLISFKDLFVTNSLKYCAITIIERFLDNGQHLFEYRYDLAHQRFPYFFSFYYP